LTGFIRYGRRLRKEKGLKASASWDERLNPAYKGMIQMADARTSGTTEASLAEMIKGAKIFPIDEAGAVQNRKRVVERWIREVLP
jgi:iron(III) transport system substrate-binding protein